MLKLWLTPFFFLATPLPTLLQQLEIMLFSSYRLSGLSVFLVGLCIRHTYYSGSIENQFLSDGIKKRIIDCTLVLKMLFEKAAPPSPPLWKKCFTVPFETRRGTVVVVSVVYSKQ